MHLSLNYILPFFIGAAVLTTDAVLLTAAVRRLRNRNKESSQERNKSMAIRDLTTIKSGQKVEVSSFEGTIAEVDSFKGTVKVRDAAGNVHYLDISQVSKNLPFEDGAVYIDSYSDKYTWRAATRNWANSSSSTRDFSYPVRPLRKYTLSATELND